MYVYMYIYIYINQSINVVYSPNKGPNDIICV